MAAAEIIILEMIRRRNLESDLEGPDYSAYSLNPPVEALYPLINVDPLGPDSHPTSVFWLGIPTPTLSGTKMQSMWNHFGHNSTRVDFLPYTYRGLIRGPTDILWLAKQTQLNYDKWIEFGIDFDIGFGVSDDIRHGDSYLLLHGLLPPNVLELMNHLELSLESKMFVFKSLLLPYAKLSYRASFIRNYLLELKRIGHCNISPECKAAQTFALEIVDLARSMSGLSLPIEYSQHAEDVVNPCVWRTMVGDPKYMELFLWNFEIYRPANNIILDPPSWYRYNF